MEQMRQNEAGALTAQAIPQKDVNRHASMHWA